MREPASPRPSRFNCRCVSAARFASIQHDTIALAAALTDCPYLVCCAIAQAQMQIMMRDR